MPLIPVAIAVEFMHAGAAPVFFASALGVIPTAALMAGPPRNWLPGRVRAQLLAIYAVLGLTFYFV